MKKFILFLGIILTTFSLFGQIASGLDAQWLGTNANNAKAWRNGDVAIGTSSTTDGSVTYKLSVDGKVRATSVKVYNTWADFVFEKDYDLPTLEEVENHIIEHGHLLDIPSAKEVEEEGIDLGQMNKLLLQKVEELTLYVIELNKQVETLKKN